MHYMFLLFITLNSYPTSPTMYIEPVTPDCRNELLFVQSINHVNDADRRGVVVYGSCEPVKD